MDQETVRARRIELVDGRGELSVILTGMDEDGRAGLIVASPEEDAAIAAISINREDEAPSIVLQPKGSAAHIILTFTGDGTPVARLEDANGNETTISPG